jgi:23S rRNA (guanine745-N1)-methyltransferase
MSPTESHTVSFPDEALRALNCSICGSSLELADRALRCSKGHSFDLAKQGYVNLLHARIPATTADTAGMVAARSRFQAAGHYGQLANEIAQYAKNILNSGLILDAGAGTGYYLTAVLEELPDCVGLALDVSALALRRAAKAHRKIGAAVWNLWQPWPVKSGCANLILNVFAPRNGVEFHRVLAPEGALIVVSPQASHLRELGSVIDMLSVDEHKEERLNATLKEHFVLTERAECAQTLTLSPEDIRNVVQMGPNAHHLHRDDRLVQLQEITEPISTTASFLISTYRPRKLQK